jgi:hypothetical protein
MENPVFNLRIKKELTHKPNLKEVPFLEYLRNTVALV